MRGVEVAVNPYIDILEQIIVGVAEAGRSGYQPVPRVGAAARRGEVCDRYRGAFERRAKLFLQPLTFVHTEVADCGSIERAVASG